MAQRVGKYKLTKREAEVSLVDGGTVNGTLVVNGDAQISNTHHFGISMSQETTFRIVCKTSTGDTKKTLFRKSCLDSFKVKVSSQFLGKITTRQMEHAFVITFIPLILQMHISWH